MTALRAAFLAPSCGENIPATTPLGFITSGFSCKSRCRNRRQRERLRALKRNFSYQRIPLQPTAVETNFYRSSEFV